MTKKALREALRKRYMTIVQELMVEKGEEVLITGSNEIVLPCVDDEGNDEFIVITFKVPTGSRDGDAYDGYAMAEDYQMKLTEKAEKVKTSAEAKAKKIARDGKMRQQKAEAKARREAG